MPQGVGQGCVPRAVGAGGGGGCQGGWLGVRAEGEGGLSNEPQFWLLDPAWGSEGERAGSRRGEGRTRALVLRSVGSRDRCDAAFQSEGDLGGAERVRMEASGGGGTGARETPRGHWLQPTAEGAVWGAGAAGQGCMGVRPGAVQGTVRSCSEGVGGAAGQMDGFSGPRTGGRSVEGPLRWGAGLGTSPSLAPTVHFLTKEGLTSLSPQAPRPRLCMGEHLKVILSSSWAPRDSPMLGGGLCILRKLRLRKDSGLTRDPPGRVEAAESEAGSALQPLPPSPPLPSPPQHPRSQTKAALCPEGCSKAPGWGSGRFHA